ncbi:hypothetical protein Tco_0605532 [Tanacetum coccineum]
MNQPSSSSQPKKDESSKKAHRREAEVPQDEAGHEESVPTHSNDPQPSAKDAQAKEITALKKRIQRLERRKMSRPTGFQRPQQICVVKEEVESSKDQESLAVLEDASKQGRSIKDIDADVDVEVMHVEAKVDGKDEQSKKPDDSTARAEAEDARGRAEDAAAGCGEWADKERTDAQDSMGSEVQENNEKKEEGREEIAKVEEQKEPEEVEEDDEVEQKEAYGLQQRKIEKDLEALRRIVKENHGEYNGLKMNLKSALYGDFRSYV